MQTAQNPVVQYLKLTASAKEQIRKLVEDKNSNGFKALGIRLFLKPKGCSGMKYAIEYVEDGTNITKYDDLFIEDDIMIFIEPKISIWIIGTEMDYLDNKISSGFVFKNPNEKGRCGCGESFYI